MNITIVYIAFFVLLIFIMIFAGKFVKKLPSNVIKIISWTSTGIGAIGLLLWFLKGDEIYKYIALGSIILYFLFYNYDSKKG
ncbi:MAG: hypothetical protein A2Z50_04655 [Nitrospirae bacterium RBG_19FT_COMBO_42_15]|nr:MAG: hypothetical protein A2Z50_04655 [Nitrospirae bacterium RBG_19FT_COMBO_42_15]